MGQIDRRCGFGPLKSISWLQRGANLFAYSFTAGLIILGVTASYSYMSAVQTTSQTVFSFSATDVGVWYAMFEIGSVISNVFASYFFTHKHIPNILSIGLLMVLAGCFLHGMPHFYHDYGDKLRSTDGNVTAADYIVNSLCYTNQSDWVPIIPETTPWVDPEIRTPSKVISIIVYSIAGFLMGAGYAPYWCLGLVYVDNNVESEHDSTKYLAIILAFYTIGPVLGFGSGALFLGMYVTLGETYLTEDSTQWIGAYWVGYVAFAAYLALFLPVIFCFPKSLPIPGYNKNEKEANVKKTSTASTNQLTSTEHVNGIEDDSLDESEDSKESPDSGDELRSIKGFLPTLGRLFINPLYMLEVLGSCAWVYYLSGWIGFLPKYYQTQFYISASDSNIYAGLLPPLFSCFTVFIGGFIASKRKTTVQMDAMLLFITSLVPTLLMIPLFFITCEQFPTQAPPTGVNMSCINNCECDPLLYTPVCYEQTTYKSPCVVGCQDYIQEGDTITYTGCLCGLNVTMTDGVCQEEKCSAPYIWTVIIIVSMATLLSCASPGVSIIMRSVDEDDKSLALGVQSSLNSLVAWIPAPILYGTIIDSTCKIWELEEDPESDWWGYCMEYDNKAFMDKYLGLTFGAMALTSVFLGIAVPVSRLARYSNSGKSSYSTDGETNPGMEPEPVRESKFSSI